MVGDALLLIWLWLGQLHPRRRLANKKRRLERVCVSRGCTRQVARRVVADFFGDDK